MDIAAAAITTGGTGAGAITNGVTIAATTIGKPSLQFGIAILIARAMHELQRRERVAPARRGRFSSICNAYRAQPNPISPAIRIRSEWFLAPSFCLSSEVVLATVL